MKDLIVKELAALGWKKDRIVDAFSRDFETALTKGRPASFWLRRSLSKAGWAISDANFTSAGCNMLAATYLELPDTLTPEALARELRAFSQYVEARVAQAWSVKLRAAGVCLT